MGTKRLKYNKETNIIEVIEEEPHANESKVVQPRQRRETVNFIISILSFVISVGALGISYSQKVANEKQVDVSVRQFNLNKRPIFQCYVEQEELYNDEDYWLRYSNWLYNNDIKTFDEWYQQKFPQKNIPSIREKRRFWDAYDNNDAAILAELTDGEYDILEFDYWRYLSSKNYSSYNRWKEYPYVYEKDYITLKNTGAYITNARLDVYTFIKYQLHIGDDISYSFAFDMNDEVLDEFWSGRYSIGANYDSGNNSFYIEYTQREQNYENEYLKLNNLLNFLSCNDILDEIGIGESDINSYYVIVKPVYFSIRYLDNEQEEQTDWYVYNRESNTLNYVDTYDSNVDVPDFKIEGFTDAFYDAETLRVAQILGYQNAQWRPFFVDENYSYIENAKEKIIADLKELVNNM